MTFTFYSVMIISLFQCQSNVNSVTIHINNERKRKKTVKKKVGRIYVLDTKLYNILLLIGRFLY